MAQFKKTILWGLGLAAISQSVYANFWDNENLLMEKELSLNADTLQAVLVDAGAGDMKIVGDTTTDTIKVSASVFGKELDEDEYQLSLEQKGGQAVLYAHVTQEHDNNERIDLKIRLPANLKLEVKDRSGDIQIESMQGGVLIDDRSGDIDLSNIHGGLEIDDRSGDISVITMAGDITINDSSGDINLITVEGDTKIQDKSGDIRVNALSGNLDIEDSSGDIRVKTVSGVVTVEDSSGNVDVDGAEDFVLVADGSGDVELNNIRSRSERLLK
jgi:DUF4097 and DUF4098 domain-containing protein YvlB